jgi:hypothetical protein
MPHLEAVTIDPVNKVVDLGPLTVGERKQLASELKAAFATMPSGAPPAGFGGASTSDGVSAGWVVAGGVLLTMSGLAGLAFWRRRRSY